MSQNPLDVFALMSTADLSANLSTAIDSSDVWKSFGKPDHAGRTTQSVDVEKAHIAQQLSAVRYGLAKEEAVALDKLLESAGESVHALAATTMLDDETAAVRGLPRATLEALVLASCATYRAQCSSSSLDVAAHPFGSILGPQFEAVVALKRAKSASVVAPELLPLSQSVIRNGCSTVIPVDELLVGDLVVLRPGDVVPCDALMLSCRPPQYQVFIDAHRISGSHLPLERIGGRYIACPTYGAASMLPQQCIVVGSESGCEALAVVLKTVASSGWILRQTLATTTLAEKQTQRHKSDDPHNASTSAMINRVETLPLFVVPYPTVHQFQRCAALRLSLCTTLVIECGSVLVDETQYGVTGVVWGGKLVSADGGISRLRNTSDVLSSTSQLSNSSSSATQHVSVHIQSFIADGSQPARVVAFDTASGMRSLAVAAMLGTCYPVTTLKAPNPLLTTSKAFDSIRQYLWNDAHVKDVLWRQYIPITDPAIIRIRNGMRVCARLFSYNISGASRDDVKRHAVLVVFGNAEVVLSASSFMASARGQVRIDSTCDTLLETIRNQVVCAPEFCVGFATADVLWDYVGTKNIPSPTDLASLLAQTTSLCFQGAFVSEVALRKPVVEGIRNLVVREPPGRGVCVLSFSRSSAKLEHLLRRCGLPLARVTTPDPIGRWLTDTPPLAGELTAFSFGSVTRLDSIFPQFFRWLRACPSVHGIGYYGASCASPIAFSATDVAITSTTGDSVVDAVLRNQTEILLSDYALDDLASSLIACEEHILNATIIS